MGCHVCYHSDPKEGKVTICVVSKHMMQVNFQRSRQEQRVQLHCLRVPSNWNRNVLE